MKWKNIQFSLYYSLFLSFWDHVENKKLQVGVGLYEVPEEEVLDGGCRDVVHWGGGPEDRGPQEEEVLVWQSESSEETEGLHEEAEMKLVVEGMEKERDFYFGKLR